MRTARQVYRLLPNCLLIGVFMKAIKGLIITLVVIVALVGVTIIGGYIYVRSTYGIDLFRTAGQLKTLSQTPDEKTLCPNAFSANDMADVKTAMDKNLNGLISYNEGEGYEGYKVDFSAITSPMPFADEIVFSSKQAGALAQTIFFGQTGGVVKIGEKELSVRLVQMDFANVSENGSTDFNVVAKVNLKPFKDEMNDFPFSLFKKYVPDELYVSSTVRVEKTDDKMGYSVAHKELKLNNLSADDTDDLFHTLDAVLKIGSAENMNLQIGTTAVNALIGNSDNAGFAYSLQALGKTTFKFTSADGGSIVIA